MPTPLYQLDIFAHSRDVMLRNDLAQAVLDGEPIAASRVAAALQAEYPDDTALPHAATLLAHLRWRQAHAAQSRLDVPAIQLGRNALGGPLPAAATALLGTAGAPGWIDAQWRWPAEALWLAPDRAAALLPALPDATLPKVVHRFEECFDTTAPLVWAWLPALALVDRPLLAGPLAAATPPADSAPAEGFGNVMALLRPERQGRHHEIVARRAQLKALSEPLFAAYMSTR